MKEYDFILKFKLPADTEASEYLTALYENGCDDAIVGIGKVGSIALDFTREAETVFEAIESAFSNVKATIPKAELIEAAPDLVSLSDIGSIIGCSRQNARKLIHGSITPAHEGKTALWHLANVLEWLQNKKNYTIDSELLLVAQMNMCLNAAKNLSKVDKNVSDKAKNLVAA